MDKGKNAQVSVEYMFIIGFVTVITIPLIIIYFNFTQESSDEIVSTQINRVAQKIVNAAESVYYFGEPSQVTIKANIPSQIILSNLSSNEVIFKMRTKSGQADIVQSSTVNITGSLPNASGTYSITVKAKSNYVEVSYK